MGAGVGGGAGWTLGNPDSSRGFYLMPDTGSGPIGGQRTPSCASLFKSARGDETS